MKYYLSIDKCFNYSENHVFYTLQAMEYIYIPNNLCELLKKYLYDIGVIKYVCSTSLQITYRMLRDYNYFII